MDPVVYFPNHADFNSITHKLRSHILAKSSRANKTYQIIIITVDTMQYLTLVLLLAASFASGTNVRTETMKKAGGVVPTNGRCLNAGSFADGNHCVKLTGETLKQFNQHAEIASYDSTYVGQEEWCVCLHDYITMWGKGGGDESACSAAALASSE